MPLEPGFDTRVFVSALVVHDPMEIQSRRGVGIDLLEEANKFLLPMARHTVSDDFPVKPAERRKPGRRPIAFIIMGLASRDSRTPGQPRLCPIQCLDWAFLVDTKHQRLIRRISDTAPPRQEASR